MTRISSQRIASLLPEDSLFAGGVHVFDSIDSTSDWSLEQLRQGRRVPFVCVADHQISGRGRRGRRWLSPAGANVCLSLAWHFSQPAARLGVLSLAQGAAVIRALDRIGIHDAWLKWPNDVMIGDAKIAGVLVETAGVRADSCNVVIGIGLNYRMPDDAILDVAMRWTDVARSARGDVPQRDELIAIVLDEAAAMCRKFQAGADAVFAEVERAVDGLKGRNVALYLENGEQFAGTVVGINALGELQVQGSGDVRVFNSADVSLRAEADSPAAGGLC